MKKILAYKLRISTVFCLLFFFIPQMTSAAGERTINVRVEGSTNNLTHQSIELPSTCTVRDSANVQHTYTNYQAVCALEKLKELGVITYQVTDWGFALALDSVNGIANASDWSQTWFIRINNVVAETGIDTLVLNQGDEMLLAYGPWPFPAPLKVEISGNSQINGSSMTATVYAWNDTQNSFSSFNSPVTLFINGTPVVAENGTYSWQIETPGTITVFAEASGKIRSASVSTGNSSLAPAPVSSRGVPKGINTSAALQFLMGTQKTNGSFGQAMFTDWAAMAMSTEEKTNPARAKIHAYLLTNPQPGEAVTDAERRAMALMSLGINPYDVRGMNYIQKIVDGFDGAQIGNPLYVNDDIFAVLVLAKAGMPTNHPVLGEILNHVLSAQNNNGSWADSTDLTAAAIQAIQLVRQVTNVDEAITKATRYLHTQQTPYGGFNNSVFSTAWAIQAMSVTGLSAADWYNNDRTPAEFLGNNQAADGGLLPDSPIDMRIWATAYALPASLEKSWGEMLASFPEREVVVPKPAPLPVPAENEKIAETPVSQPIQEERQEIQEENDTIEPVVPSTLPATTTPVAAVEPPIESVPLPLAKKTTPRRLEEETPALETTVEQTEAPEEADTITDSEETLAPTPETSIPATRTSGTRMALTLATTLGAYLVWRTVQTLV